MKRSSAAQLVLLICLAAGASAQINPHPDGIGIYFDTGATDNCIYTTAPAEQVVAYLIVTQLTEPSGVSWWDCRLGTEGPLTGAVWTLAGGGVNIEAAPCFHVKLPVGEPLPHAPAIVLATMSGTITDPTQACLFYVRSACLDTGPFAGGAPVYGAGDDPRRVQTLRTPFAELHDPYADPVAAISYDLCHVQPNEARTWSAVKDLYR